MVNLGKYRVLSLSTILKDKGREEAEETLLTFAPVHKDSTPAEFLYKQAIMMELKDISRTYLLMPNVSKISGFFTLSIKCTRVQKGNQLSKTTLRNMNIEESTGVAQSYLLGQLCRAEDSEAGLGMIMMDEAMRKARVCMEIVGCRMIRLDCNDDMVEYYRKAGFKLMGKNPDGDLNQMMSFLK